MCKVEKNEDGMYYVPRRAHRDNQYSEEINYSPRRGGD
jgi:hypothetical protein